ncbi:MAG: hydrolase [Actinomycetia bacterium]|nr:hydrolase [Actinomycetes bacterium]
MTPGALIGSVTRPGPAGVTYDIHDYAATVTGGMLRAGDDAAEVRWATDLELRVLPTTPGLLEALTEWNVLPGH